MTEIEQLKADNSKLRTALVLTIGVDGKEDLDKIEKMVLEMSEPNDPNRPIAIAGINALRDTLTPHEGIRG